MQIYITTTRITFSSLSSIGAKDPTRDCYVPGDLLHAVEIYSLDIALSRTFPYNIQTFRRKSSNNARKAKQNKRPDNR